MTNPLNHAHRAVSSLVMAAALLCYTVAIPTVATISVVMATGCKSSPKTVAYNSLRATALSVDSAMKVYGQLCAQDRVPAETQAKIDSIHAKYSMSMQLAIRAARFDYTATTPEDVGALASQITSMVVELIQ